MKQLTFKGFLRRYLKDLSYCGASNIRLLANEIPNGSYRLVEPLVLYAKSTSSCDYLRRVADDSILLTEAFRFEDKRFEDVISLLECELKKESGDVPFNYIKVYQSYIYIRNKQKNQNHTKMLIRNRINELLAQKGISVYRIYTDLGLNHGCVHAYIKNNNVNGISLITARRILEYMKSA